MDVHRHRYRYAHADSYARARAQAHPRARAHARAHGYAGTATDNMVTTRWVYALRIWRVVYVALSLLWQAYSFKFFVLAAATEFFKRAEDYDDDMGDREIVIRYGIAKQTDARSRNAQPTPMLP
jgi:hypothetical protein